MTRFPITFLLVAVAIFAFVGLRASFAEDQMANGDRLAAEGKLSEAVAAYSAILQQDPARADAHARLGGMYLMQQKYTDAIKSFQQSISLDAEQARAFVGMGMAYLHTGRRSLARAALEEAKRIKPELSGDIDPVIVWMDQDSREVDLAGH